MFLAPLRKTVRCRTISLSFSLPFFPSLLSFSPNNHFSFFSFPAKRTTTTTQFVLPSPLPPPPSRYLRLTDFFATFFHPCVFFPYPPLSFHLFFSFFFSFSPAPCFSSCFTEGEWEGGDGEGGGRGVKPVRGWLVDVSLGGRDRNHSRDGYLIFPDGYVFYSHFFPSSSPKNHCLWWMTSGVISIAFNRHRLALTTLTGKRG